MDNLQAKADGFKLLYEKFLTGCDAFEEENLWNKDNDGEMEAFYFNDIMCVILRLVSADGVFAREEADYVNNVFGFRYTPEELAELYRVQGEDIDAHVLRGVPEGYRKLETLCPELAELYRQLLLQVCDVMSESDGSVHETEKKLIADLKAALK